ncbi:protein kinase UbiB [uncultured archaeon]|nr:protein kinase UbiB [uncultured archaeon]
MAGSDFLSLRQNERELKRTAHILNIVAKFGMRSVVERIRIGEKLHLKVGWQQKENIEKTTEKARLRMLLEELATTFVKFGQILSTREDLVGQELADELAKLQDSMRPFPSQQARHEIEAQLGKSIKEVFSSFDDNPIASASIAQVHRAMLKNGKAVVVKVQRPGIEETIREDTQIMHYLATMLDKYVPEMKHWNPKLLVDEFERSIMKELDFQREAKSAIRMRDNFSGEKGVYIPMVYEHISTSRVLVMEEARGTRLSDVIRSNLGKYDKTLIARRGADAFFKMVLEDGFYHADPHPGNILVMKGNVVCFLDFGRVGSVDKELAMSMLRLVTFAVDNDPRGLVMQLSRMGLIDDGVDVEAFTEDMADLLDTYYSRKLEEVQMGHLLRGLFSVTDKYGVRSPRAFTELSRALFILEGVGMALNPKFNAFAEFRPYASRAAALAYSPKRLETIIRDNILDVEYMVKTFPGTLRKIMNKLESGEMKVELVHTNLASLAEDLDRMSNKLSLAMVLAAMVVGSSIVIGTSPTLGRVGFAISFVLGLWLAVKILLYRPND